MAKKANTTKRSVGARAGGRSAGAGRRGTSAAKARRGGGGGGAKGVAVAAKRKATAASARGGAKGRAGGGKADRKATTAKAKAGRGGAAKRSSGKATASRRTTAPPRGAAKTTGRAGGQAGTAKSVRRGGAAARQRSGAPGKSAKARAGGAPASTTAGARRQGGVRAKVGSDASALRRTGGAGDFGLPAAGQTAPQPIGGREKGPQQGTGPMRAGTQGDRVSGVGGDPGGPGHSSGGDLDPDFVGIAGAGGLSEFTPGNAHPGQAATTGGSAEFASGGPAQGRNQDRATGGPRAGGRKQVDRGSTVDRGGGDASTTGPESGLPSSATGHDRPGVDRERFLTADFDADVNAAPELPDFTDENDEEAGDVEPPAYED